MKELIANACIWTLGKLGYEKGYSKKNEIVITVDADQAINNIIEAQKAIMKLRYELDNLSKP